MISQPQHVLRKCVQRHRFNVTCLLRCVFPPAGHETAAAALARLTGAALQTHPHIPAQQCRQQPHSICALHVAPYTADTYHTPYTIAPACAHVVSLSCLLRQYCMRFAHAGLQDLTVLSPSSHLLLPATSALTALTRACLLLRELPQTAQKLQHLPPQLRKLEITVGWAAGISAGSRGSSRPPLPLKHLTGLCELRGSGYFALQVRRAGVLLWEFSTCSGVRISVMCPILHAQSACAGAGVSLGERAWQGAHKAFSNAWA